MAGPLLIAKGQKECFLIPRMVNRHGLIAGATGTGKTVTLQMMTENLSRLGVPVFLADIKGDLAGISQPGSENPKVQERIKLLGLENFISQKFPTVFWDVFGKSGHPLRATVSDMGPLLLGRLLNLNEVQTGVLTVVFKIADDNGLLLLDLKDLQAMVQTVGDKSQEFTTTYGNISKASIGTIQRGLMELAAQDGEKFFGEPMLDIWDLIQTDTDGRGIINILAADQLYLRPKIYATFLLWLLAELFEQLPEVGDLDKPKFVFFFDEAHLLFEDASPALLEKVEQVVRLVRSKGVGVYFVTQNPQDVPEKILAQLGNRVQHALRAFTPQDQKAIKAMAQTFRPNPRFKVDAEVIQLGVGEALVSLLEENGSPAVVEKGFVLPPHSRIGAITSEERQRITTQSVHFGHYEKTMDRESAYEIIKSRNQARMNAAPAPEQNSNHIPFPKERPPAQRGRPADDMMTTVFKSTARSIGSSLGRQIVRGVLGSIFRRREAPIIPM